MTQLIRTQPPKASVCNDEVYREIGLVGTESTSSSAEERECSTVANRKRVELPDPEAANYDGYVDCDGVGYPMGSISLTAWADKWPTEPEDSRLRTREAITSAAPRFRFDCLPTTAVGSPSADREQKKTASLLAVDGGGGSGSNVEYVKRMEGEEENGISPPPKYSSKGGAIVELNLDKEDWGGGSSSNSTSYPTDITAEDWLHAAATVNPMPTTKL